jgi:E3 ubiquitin-protein ligase RFWD2
MAVAPGISGAHGIDAEREAEKNRKDEDESELELEDEARARSRWGRQSLSRRGQAMGQTHVPPSKPHIASSQHLEPLERHHQRTSETADTTHGNDGGKGPVELLCSNKRRRIASQFEDLQSVYLQLRSSRHGNGTGDAEEGCVRPDQSPDAAIDSTSVDRIMTSSASSSGLRQFSKILGTLAHANRLRILAEIPRPPIRNQSSIISSVEYDRNGKFFATAGVSKRISVFDHTNTVVNAMRGLPIAHCPIVEMVTRSKLSCISWNKFISSELASSDYEGVLNVWDSSTGNLVHEYEAHSKRIWSVDFCCADPKLLVTGSDDSFVKVWSTRSPSAISQFDVKANVCAVKWHPTQPHTVAIGAADHNVYIYDMRKYDTSMSSFSGHKKAVSYVRWASDDEIVSASTDCTLRLWNTQRAELLGGACAREERTYRGHVNERNFVGLAVSNDFIVCGSETHEVYTYYKPLSKPITKIALPVAGAVGAGGPLGRGQARERPFVSALSWHPAKKELLTATSQGSVFVLSLEGELDDTRE